MKTNKEILRMINDTLEYFRHEIFELYEKRPPLTDLENYVLWTNDVITLQTRWIKTLENKIHHVRRHGEEE